MKSKSLVIFLVVIARASGWSLFKASREHSAKALLKTLKKGRSTFDEHVKVVSVGRNECGIQLEGPESTSTDVVYVDRDEFLTPAMGQATSVGQAVEKYFENHQEDTEMHKNLLPSIYMALYLCLCRYGDEVNNRFSSYVATLPSLKELRHLPVFWTNDALAELQGSTVLDGIETRKEFWIAEHQLVQNALDEAGLKAGYKYIDEETWFWARAIICSRAFTDEYTDSPCLVPYVDMMNHMTENDQQTGHLKCSWDIDSTGYHLQLPKDTPPHHTTSNNRLGISYGSCSNGAFLMNYGFSIFDDESQIQHENAVLSIKLPQAFSLAGATSIWEADGLGDCHEVSRNVRVSIGEAGPMESVLSMCRVASAQNEAELSKMQGNFRTEAMRTPDTADGLVPQLGATLCRSPFSESNEILALRMLERILLDSLRRYSTTLDRDNLLLTSKRISSDHRNAILVRRGEKQVILHFEILISLALRFLENKDGDFDTYKGMLEASLGNGRPLINTII